MASRQPVETLDSIVCLLDAPEDVLAFALVCKRFYDVAHPRHTQYRAICCGPEEFEDLWIALAKDRTLAKNVRSITLYDRHRSLTLPHTPQRVPTAVIRHEVILPTTASRAGISRLVIASLRNTSSLNAFTFACHPDICAPRKGGSDSVWITLKETCSELRDVRVVNASGYDADESVATRRSTDQIGICTGTNLVYF